jgi:hypothetical protein
VYKATGASDCSAPGTGLTWHHSPHILVEICRPPSTSYPVLTAGLVSPAGVFLAYCCLCELTVPTLQASRLLRLSPLVLT